MDCLISELHGMISEHCLGKCQQWTRRNNNNKNQKAFEDKTSIV